MVMWTAGAAGATHRHQSARDVSGPVRQSAHHVDFRFSGCPAQRGPTKTRQQRDRADRGRRVRADAVSTEPSHQRQQPH